MVQSNDAGGDAGGQAVDLIVIGAGLAGLHVAAKLPESVQKSTVVIDAEGGWLKRWSRSGDRLQVSHMRTPVTVHPHPSPLALQSYAQKKGRTQELATVAEGFAPVPSRQLLQDFIQAKVVAKLPAAVRRVVQEEVTSLRLTPDQGVEVQLSSGRTITGRLLVYAAAPTRPVLPAWAKQLLGPPDKAGEALAGETATTGRVCGGTSAQAAQSTQGECPSGQYAFPPGLLTHDQVNLSGSQLEGQHVVVVGGGMTAATLAAGAVARGARVTIVCRRPLKQQPFTCEVGWWGPKQLHGFGQLPDPCQRLEACRQAKQQGSIHAPLWEALVAAAASEQLVVVEGAEVDSCQQWRGGSSGGSIDSAGGSSGCRGGSARSASLVPACQEGPAEPAVPEGAPLWYLGLASSKFVPKPSSSGAGTADGSTAVPALTPFQAAVAAALQQQGQQAQPAQQGQRAASQLQLLRAHAIWLACGSAYHTAHDALLRQLQAQRPALLVGGYPLIDDVTLAWPGAPVLLAGRAAMLAVGPCAGDLGGMRLAADRIAAALKKLHFAGEPFWAAAGRQLAAVPLDEAAAAKLPLEEEGVPYEPPRPRVSVAKPDHLIDVSDLPTSLPRVELQHYKFSDDDFEVCVILELPETVEAEQVRTKFGERTLEMWAVGAQAAYRLYIPCLYGRIILKKCRARVKPASKKVYLLLHKESDAEWRFLKS